MRTTLVLALVAQSAAFFSPHRSPTPGVRLDAFKLPDVFGDSKAKALAAAEEEMRRQDQATAAAVERQRTTSTIEQPAAAAAGQPAADQSPPDEASLRAQFAQVAVTGRATANEIEATPYIQTLLQDGARGRRA